MANDFFDVVHTLGITSAGTTYENPTGWSPDYNIAGIEFLSMATDDYPYQRQLSKVRKDQFDSSLNPGDNSLQGWWTRTQTDWSFGAGYDYMEPITTDGIDRAFYASAGVDVFNDPGNISLLPTGTSTTTVTTASAPCIVAIPNGYVWAAGTTVKRVVGGVTDTDTALGNVTQLVVAGPNILAVSSGKIEWAPITGTFNFTTGFTCTGTPKAWWIKSRILMSLGAEVHENPGSVITGSTNLDSATPLYDLLDTTISIVGAASTPSAILLAVNSASGSTIQSLTVDAAGDLPSSSAPRIVAEFPPSETLYAISTYLGTYVALSTSHGIRIGQTDDSGGITYGPLLNSPTASSTIRDFTVFDRFIHYPVTDAGDDRSGVVRIDLSGLDSTGRAPWSTFLRLTGTTTVVHDSIITDSNEGYLVSTDGVDAVLWTFDSTNDLDTGWLQTSAVRFGTLENKQYENVRLSTSPNLEGSVAVASIDDNGAELHMGSTVSGNHTVTLSTGLRQPQEQLSLLLTLTPDGPDGPNVTAWTMKALPAVEDRGEEVLIPMANFDFERDGKGVRTGYEGRAWERWQALRDRLSDGTSLIIQEYRSGGSYVASTQDCSFTQVAPPSAHSGFGGVINLVIRAT